jgi:micrococcal nuclease
MYEYRFRLTRVLDGDSLEGDIDLGFDVWLNKVIVRLDGIDAPETRRLSYVDDQTLRDDLKSYGKFAKGSLAAFLLGHDYLRIRTVYKNQSDKYGRVLATVYNGDININQLMLDQRMAVAYNGPTNRELLLEQHVANMNFYKEQGLIEGF